MNKPVLLVVDDDPQVLAAVRRDLRSRYREHYTVLSAGSGQEALATARELKSRGDSLAMVMSDQLVEAARLEPQLMSIRSHQAWLPSAPRLALLQR